MDKTQLREMVDTVLVYLEPEIKYSRTARELLMLTCATESHLGKYLRQLEGPARGIMQMEPATEKDIWNNFMIYNPKLWNLVKEVIGTPNFTFPALQWNLAYQIAMARIHYFRVPARFPHVEYEPDGDLTAHSITGLAGYWKEYYNTRLGKGTVSRAYDHYERFVK